MGSNFLLKEVKMKKSRYIAYAVFAMGLMPALSPEPVYGEQQPGMEKCYGVAKAGKNDCDAVSGAYPCTQQSKVDGDKNAWVLVPKGLCDKLVNGSTTPGGDVQSNVQSNTTNPVNSRK